MNRQLILSFALVLAAAASAQEAPKEHAGMHAQKPASKELEMIKVLVGDWKGTGQMEGKPTPVTTSFRMTAGGSAVVETMDAGTPHEMTNVYHDVDGKMRMTHYCAIGNAPEMKVSKSSGDSIALESIKANGIDPKATPHMHALAYAMGDKDHLKATWTSANMGKEHEAPAVFEYTRVGAEPSK
jgi:hypothetical protein